MNKNSNIKWMCPLQSGGVHLCIYEWCERKLKEDIWILKIILKNAFATHFMEVKLAKNVGQGTILFDRIVKRLFMTGALVILAKKEGCKHVITFWWNITKAYFSSAPWNLVFALRKQLWLFSISCSLSYTCYAATFSDSANWRFHQQFRTWEA